MAGRLQDMDKMGVEAQVIFPTFFIRYGPGNPESEAAVTGAYNRWLAERCAMSNGRLRWAAVLPLLGPGQSGRGAALGEGARSVRNLQARVRLGEAP